MKILNLRELKKLSKEELITIILNNETENNKKNPKSCVSFDHYKPLIGENNLLKKALNTNIYRENKILKLKISKLKIEKAVLKGKFSNWRKK